MTDSNDSTSIGDEPEISFIVSCYFEEESIAEFYRRLKQTLEQVERSYEIIFTNDGSTDGTWPQLNRIWEQDSKVSTIIDFFRNSGQQAALTAGMVEARGSMIAFMDSDLQLKPEEFPLLLEEYDKGFDMVTGYRRDRKDSLSRILPSQLANMIMRKASRSNLSDFGCTFKIYNAKILKGMNLGPFHLFSNVDAIASISYYREIPITHLPRKYGKSGWTFRKLWKYNMDNIVSLSGRPFQYIGVTCLLLAMLFIIRIALGYYIDVKFMSYISNGLLLNSIIVSLFIIVGVLCLVGEFTIRTFLISRRMPSYIVRSMHKRDYPNRNA